MADCNFPLVGIDNQLCGPDGTLLPAFGKQITQLLYQSSKGVAPSLALIASAQAAMTAEDEDQVFTLKNIAAAIVAAATDQTLSGNDVAFGVTLLTGRQRTLTGRVQYVTPATITAVNTLNALNQAGETLRVWPVDEKSYLQGPLENVSLVFGSLQRAGAGQNLPPYFDFTMTWEAIDEAPVTGPFVYLKTLTNAA